MTIRQKVLIADGDREYSRRLVELFSANGYEPLVAGTAEEALGLITSHCPEVTLLEPDLPDMDGIKILSAVREWSLMPIVFLSSDTDEDRKVSAMDHGADDYIVKSCGDKELLARVRMALRHTRTGYNDLRFANEGIIVIGHMRVDYNKLRVYVEDEDANLTQNEYKMVSLLAKYAGCVLTYDRIIRELWGPNMRYDNQILRVHMTNIRKKLRGKHGLLNYIHTENGVGYRMVSNEDLERRQQEEENTEE